MRQPASSRPPGGISGALSELAGTAIGLVHTRLELATVEFEEERERVKDVLVLVVVAAVFLCFAFAMLSSIIIILFWSTYPLTAVCTVTAAYIVIGGGALLMLRRRIQARPFAATLAELERDAESLRGRR